MEKIEKATSYTFKNSLLELSITNIKEISIQLIKNSLEILGGKYEETNSGNLKLEFFEEGKYNASSWIFELTLDKNNIIILNIQDPYSYKYDIVPINNIRLESLIDLADYLHKKVVEHQKVNKVYILSSATNCKEDSTMKTLGIFTSSDRLSKFITELFVSKGIDLSYKTMLLNLTMTQGLKVNYFIKEIEPNKLIVDE